MKTFTLSILILFLGLPIFSQNKSEAEQKSDELYEKGVISANEKNIEKAIDWFQEALVINPNHAESLNAIGMLEMRKNRIPAILSFAKFLTIENQTSRSEKNLECLKKLL